MRKYAGKKSLTAKVRDLICKKIKDKGEAELGYIDILFALRLPEERKPAVQKAVKLLKKKGIFTIIPGKSHQKSKYLLSDRVKSI